MLYGTILIYIPSSEHDPVAHFALSARQLMTALLLLVMQWPLVAPQRASLSSVYFLRPSVVEVQTQAGELADKEQLLDNQGHTHVLGVSHPVSGSFEVYNIEVSGLHTYFVGENRVLVHNKAMKAIKPGVFKGEHLLEELAEAEQDLVHRLIDHGQDVTLLPGKPPVVKVNGQVIPDEALEAYVRTLDEMGKSAGEIVKDVNLKNLIEQSGMTTREAGEFFGWGNKEITKPLSSFSRESLEAAGWTKDKLLNVAEGYRRIAEATPNKSAPLRAEQLENLAKLFKD